MLQDGSRFYLTVSCCLKSCGFSLYDDDDNEKKELPVQQARPPRSLKTITSTYLTKIDSDRSLSTFGRRNSLFGLGTMTKNGSGIPYHMVLGGVQSYDTPIIPYRG